MGTYDNPAGRLHEALLQLSKRSRQKSLVSSWSEVLGVEESDVPLHLGAVGQLVLDVQQAVSKVGDEPLVATVARYKTDWTTPIFPRDHALAGPLSNVMPADVALEALALIATHLHRVAPDGAIPDDDELERLKEQLRNALGVVEASTDLPKEVQHLLVNRLAAVLEAIEHLRIGGPEAVRLATEALVGAVAMKDPEAFHSPTGKRILAVVGVIWVAFSASPTIEASIDAWGQIARELSAGQVAEQPQPSEPSPTDAP